MDSQFLEFPDFSTQESQYEIGEEVSQTSKKRAPKGSFFNPEEDKLLISARLNIVMDPVTCNEQKAQAFWGKITDYYHQYKNFDLDHSQQMLSQRWGKIQKEIADTKSLYEEQENKRFTLDHAWVILRHQPKWIQTLQEVDAKTSKTKSKPTTTNTSSFSTTSTHIDIDEDITTCFVVPRPPGNKVEKRKLKRNISTRKNSEITSRKKKDEKKLEIMKEKVEVDKEKLRVRKFEVEMRIMSMDIYVMNDEERAYYSKLRMKILHGNL
ncbi:glutathione S-transferase T3-like [Argentina anserina]|uniref:glutathione S-transferase T3-like n=1 Tax=Argentina anserina TaxID=57926 RepID=UPI0021763E8D|nr:glutathione S-transferase T3-like [Potentilla anserina]